MFWLIKSGGSVKILNLKINAAGEQQASYIFRKATNCNKIKI